MKVDLDPGALPEEDAVGGFLRGPPDRGVVMLGQILTPLPLTASGFEGPKNCELGRPEYLQRAYWFSRKTKELRRCGQN